ncbi:MAG TPA: GMC family oxidoreductase N-terminal domain-containing protein, partial [Steroidobacteraceae bacterium]|nr:GMC family oxidoreductase N-terminal domain-containing protein [Steroidobacteraceae bacterium]
ERAELADAFIEAAVPRVSPAIRTTTTGHQEGFGYFQATQKNGRRWSTARAFLDPARPRPNLHIETEALATGVLLDGKRAVGVPYVQRGEAREARCGGEVILCAGAVKSPHLLELSGIGNPEILQSVGITVRHELRGVGENYRDHYAPRMNWRVTLPITLNEQTRGIALVKEIVKYYAQRRGVLSLAAALVHGFVRTGPELEVPDVQYLFSHASYSDPQVRALDREPGMTVTLYQCRPESTGSIHVKSPDPAASPAIRPNYLADELDRRTLVAGMKIARRIVNNKALDRYRAFEMNPGDRCQTDDELLGFARQYGLSHGRHVQDGPRPEGSCKRRITGTWASELARSRCVHHADDDFRQHQRPGDNDRRKGRRHGQGYRLSTGASRIARSRSRLIELGGSGLPGCCYSNSERSIPSQATSSVYRETCYFTSARKLGVGSARMSACLDAFATTLGRLQRRLSCTRCRWNHGSLPVAFA